MIQFAWSRLFLCKLSLESIKECSFLRIRKSVFLTQLDASHPVMCAIAHKSVKNTQRQSRTLGG